MTYQPGSPVCADQGAMLPERDVPTSASEQMYFYGAPLAHVVRYEEEQRAASLRRAYNTSGLLWMPLR